MRCCRYNLLVKTHTDDNIADIYTKVLDKAVFERHRDKLVAKTEWERQPHCAERRQATALSTPQQRPSRTAVKSRRCLGTQEKHPPSLHQSQPSSLTSLSISSQISALTAHKARYAGGRRVHCSPATTRSTTAPRLSSSTRAVLPHTFSHIQVSAPLNVRLRESTSTGTQMPQRHFAQFCFFTPAPRKNRTDRSQNRSPVRDPPRHALYSKHISSSSPNSV